MKNKLEKANKFTKDKKILFGIIIGIIFILSIGITYAWFSIVVKGDPNNMVVKTGTLSLKFTDEDKIELLDAFPGDKASKIFTVENTGTLSTSYTIWWKDFSNTIENNELVYTITCKSYSDYANKVEGGNCFGVEEKVMNTPDDLRLISNIEISPNYTHEYEITVKFKEMSVNQDYNQGKHFYGTINIKEYYVNENDTPEIVKENISNKVVTATVRDTVGITEYAVSYPIADAVPEDLEWIKVKSTKELNLELELVDYDAILWAKNRAGNIGYLYLVPRSSLVVEANGGIWNGMIGSQTYIMKYGETKEISEPTREGHEFGGWDINTEGTEHNITNTTFTMGEKDITLTAKWIPNKYNLIINPNGGQYNNSTETITSVVEYKSENEILEPTREGYTFTHWTVSSTKATLNTNILTIGSEDCTLTANYVVNSYPWVAYHNQMNTNGQGYTKVEADTENGTLNYGEKIIPTVKTYTGFNSPEAIELTIKTSNNIVNYNYERQKYNLVINANGGTYSGTSPIEVYYKQEINIENPSKYGYNFTNWSLSGGGSLTGKLFTGGLSETRLTANYTAIKSTVTFNSNGGESVSFETKQVTYDEEYGELPTVSREGYEFIGWFTSASGGTEIKSTTTVGITSAQTLYAQWQNSNLTFAEINNYSCQNIQNGSYYVFTYTGNCEVIDDGNDDWRVKFLTSGTLTINESLKIDAFLVGGGGGGSTSGYNITDASVYLGGGGGGGGYTTTRNSIELIEGTTYEITVGNGGGANASGGTTTAFSVEALGGSPGGSKAVGGKGGSGGGAGTQAGGTNGNNGVRSPWNVLGGLGQNFTTGEFGDENNTIYSAGGRGGTGSSKYSNGTCSYAGDTPTNGASNTGNGGSGGGNSCGSMKSPGTGGSGIVVIRNHRSIEINDEKIGDYTGVYTVENTDGEWNIKFLTSGNFIPNKNLIIDAFLVGGGGGGSTSGYNITDASVYLGGGGGGGGYTTTRNSIELIEGTTYEITVGNGGGANASGGTTTAFSVEALGGSPGGSKAVGGKGGSGGGAGTQAGGTNGGNGVSSPWNVAGGTGQGTTTGEFGDANNTIYSAGGKGGTGSSKYSNGTCSYSAGTPATGKANTGNGGAGNGNSCGKMFEAGRGGSGIVVIRETRE